MYLTGRLELLELLTLVLKAQELLELLTLALNPQEL
jgi:hypothetical protein